MLLALASLAAAAPDGAATRGSVAAGVGGSFVVGGNAKGYAAGLAERVVVEVATGRYVAFGVELDHARHALADASAYFPEAPVPAGSMAGFRDYVVIDAGFRFGIPVRAPTDPIERVRATPWIRLGVGLALTSTLLDAPGFDGRVALRSNTAWPAPSLGVGVDVRLRRWISVVPQVKSQVQVFEDTAESASGPTQVGVEGRFQPALDVSIHF